MRIFLLICLVILLGISVLSSYGAAKKDKYLVVKLSDRAKAVSYTVMTEDEYKEEVSKLELEKHYWTKALRLAEKEWTKKSEEERKTFRRFPKTAVSVQKISAISRPTYDRETAHDKLEKIEEKVEEREEEKEEREKDKVDKVRYEFTRHADDPIQKRRMKKRYSRYDERKEELASARESELDYVRLFFDQVLSRVIEDSTKQ